MKAILAFKSQFYDPDSNEPETKISSKGFMDFIQARSREMGRQIGVEFGEGYTTEGIPGVRNLFDLL